MAEKLVAIKIHADTLEKLKALKHTGQSIDGVIQELLEKKAEK